MVSDLVGDGSNVVIGLGGGVPLLWGGVVVRLVVLALQTSSQLKGQPHGSGGGALDLALQVSGTLAGHCSLGLHTGTSSLQGPRVGGGGGGGGGWGVGLLLLFSQAHGARYETQPMASPYSHTRKHNSVGVLGWDGERHSANSKVLKTKVGFRVLKNKIGFRV